MSVVKDSEGELLDYLSVLPKPVLDLIAARLSRAADIRSLRSTCQRAREACNNHTRGICFVWGDLTRLCDAVATVRQAAKVFPRLQQVTAKKDLTSPQADWRRGCQLHDMVQDVCELQAAQLPDFLHVAVEEGAGSLKATLSKGPAPPASGCLHLRIAANDLDSKLLQIVAKIRGAEVELRAKDLGVGERGFHSELFCPTPQVSFFSLGMHHFSRAFRISDVLPRLR